jgi:hypothetical protein
LARELFRAVTEELAKYQRTREQSAERPDPAQPPSAEYVAALLAKPAEDVTFFDLERIARADPARSAARWGEVKATAARDLASGWTAARALEPLGGSAWKRAEFHALRHQFRQAWPPRNGGEALLIDQLAQYEIIRQKWVGVLVTMSSDSRTILTMQHPPNSREKPRPMTAADATREALAAVERLQRLVHGTLRMLLALRRGMGPLVVHRAGQVNVAAGPQLNVSQTAERPAEPSDTDQTDR